MPIFVILYTLPKKSKRLYMLLYVFAFLVFFYNALRWFGMFAIPI